MQKTHQSAPRQRHPAPAARIPRWWRRRPPAGVDGAVFWLALGFGLLWLLRLAPSGGGLLLGWMQLLVGLALLSLALPLAWRLLYRHLLWSLRNKLILTYLLIGLAPVVLFLTLAAISAYIAAGQFSIHLADTRMHQQLDEIGVDNSARASRQARMMRDRAGQPMGQPPPGTPGFQRRPRSTANGAASRSAARASAAPAVQTAAEAAAQLAAQNATLGETAPDPLLARLHRHTSFYLNGAPYTPPQLFAPPAATGAQPTVAQQPSQATQPSPA